jgi:tetratricopeptide (TPR) repeat protein
MTGETERAFGIFRNLLAARPDDFDASFGMAFLLRDTGKPAEAGAVLLKASEQAGLTSNQLLQIAGFLRDSSQHDPAIRILKRVIDLAPNQADLHFKLARLYQATGEFELALESLRKTLDIDPSTGPAWTALAQQKRFDSTDDPDYKRIQIAVCQSLGAEADMCIRFAIGKALDDLQQCSAAWDNYEKGNELMAMTTPWDLRAWETFVRRSIESTRQAQPASTLTGRNAVVIVGMPRSGTTLLEQMLDRHPAISGRGELTQMRLEGPEDGVFIDKNPLNFRFLEILFDVMPTAKVLHVSRDGRDSALSCFFQLFDHPDNAFSYKLEHLVAFYGGYRRLMAHWERIYASKIYRVRYEDLLDSREEVLANVLRFLGLDWHDAMIQQGAQDRVVGTADDWQARQPAHTLPVGRWREYADQAPEFFKRLSDIDAEFNAQTID